MIASTVGAPVCPFPAMALSLPKGKRILSLCVIPLVLPLYLFVSLT